MELEKKDKQHSIEVSRTSTGKYSYSVKFYFEDVSDSDSILNLIFDAEAILQAKYPTIENKKIEGVFK